MLPRWYCDAMPLLVGGDTGASGAMLRNGILGQLHGLFSQRPDAVPSGEAGDVQQYPAASSHIFSLLPVNKSICIDCTAKSGVCIERGHLRQL